MSEEEKELTWAEREESKGGAASRVVKRALEEVEDEEVRETNELESAARVLKRLVRSEETSSRDCESCSFSAATDDERARSELETALPEEVKEEKGEYEEIADADSSTTEARSLKPADRSEI